MLAAVKAFRKVHRKCSAKFLKGAPPEPCEDVMLLLKSVKVKQAEIIQMYETFHFLKQSEKEDEMIIDAGSINVNTVRKLVKERRKWVLKLLLRLLDLGGCKDRLDWNHFLWILIRFASLNRVELAQTMFLLIQTEVNSSSIHYLTATHLQEFFNFYRDCPVPAFNTHGIEFDKMPFARIYAADFVELTSRFQVLVNPLLELQRIIQYHLPGHKFWDNLESQLFCRKIYFDFFVMGTSRVHLRGEPAFRETCDMLLPDAMGAKAINIEQWVLRTSHCRDGRGLRQVSAWGEQPLPELIAQIKQQLADEIASTAAPKKERRTLASRRRLGSATARAKGQASLPEPAADADSDEEAEGSHEALEEPGGLGDGTLPRAELSPQASLPQPAADADSGAEADGSPGGLGDGALPRPAWTPPEEKTGVATIAGLPVAVAESTAVVPLAAGAATDVSGSRRGGGGAPTPLQETQAEPSIDANLLSLFAATLDESHAGPMDCLPPTWMKGAAIAPAKQLPSWGSVPAARTLGRGFDVNGFGKTTGSCWGVHTLPSDFRGSAF